MSFTFAPAKREQVSLLIALAGASGSGKTFSALRLAENRTHEDAMRFVVSFIRSRTDKESSDD